jgi:hypothetical protein
MSINLIRKVSNDLTKNRQYNLKNIWSIKHNTCSYIQSNSNQLKTGGQFRYDMSLRKTNIFKHIMITVEFVFAISHNFKYCHCWTIITFIIINVWTHVFFVDRWVSDSETGFDSDRCFIYVVWYFTTIFLA